MGLRVGAPRSASAGTEVVFVSLPVGTIPTGVSASISARSGTQVVPLVNGGMDPTPVAAASGDTLQISVSLSQGAPLHFIAVVPIRARPIVVRSNPPPQKRDVPLNVSLLVVFSEPIDAAILGGAAIQLQTGARTIPGQVEFADPAHLTVLFLPNEPLQPLTDYELRVTSEVRDLSGEALETTVVIPFTTIGFSGLRVTIATEGEAPDPDGYVLAVAGQTNQVVGANGAAFFPDLPPGNYYVYLSGLATNCVVLGSQHQDVAVQAGALTSIRFHVACPAMPPNSLLVHVTTDAYGTGWSFRFFVNLDDAPGRSISENGYLVLGPVIAGDHTVTLDTGLPGSCFVSSSSGVFNPVATVNVPANGYAKVVFSVVCVP